MFTACRRILSHAIFMALLGFALKAPAAEIYVAPGGNDAAQGTKEQPLGTVERARDKVRELKSAPGGLKEPVRVILRGGTYLLKAPLTFSPADSGTETAPIVYAAAEGETPLISGGQPIKNWKPGTINGKACWVAELGTAAQGQRYFKEMFVAGTRRLRTRLPKEGFFRFSAANPKNEWRIKPESLLFADGDLKNWANLGDVELVMLNRWVDGHNTIARVDEAANKVTFSPRAMMGVMDSKNLPARYYVSNVKEALTEPGQWYLDRSAWKLYYLPLKGETPEKVEAVAPRLEMLLRLEGTGKQKIHGLRFENLDFRYAESSITDPARQAASIIPGAVALQDAVDCTFYGCAFANIGAYAAEVAEGCADNCFIACRFENLAAGGVKIDAGSEHTTIADCTLKHGGQYWHSAVGVLVMDSARNRVLHNEIADFNYTGVSAGWVWGYGPTQAFDNLIEYNHIYDLGHGMLDDMGGIYTLGTQAGTVLRGNVIHDVSKYEYGGWGIYPDEGSSGLLIEGNLTYRTQGGGFHQHYGRDNFVRNNIFALDSECALRRSRNETIRSFTIARNIIYLGPKEKVLESNWGDGNYTMRENIYWREGGGVIDFQGKSLAEWQRAHHDQGSVVADPLFADPKAGNFTLKPESPAFKKAFKPIDAGQAGPRKLDPRKIAFKDWPATEPAPRPIVERRLEDMNLKNADGPKRFQKPRVLKAGKPYEMKYHLWNRSAVQAKGNVVFRMQPAEAAKIQGQTTMDYSLKPGEMTTIQFQVIAEKNAANCQLVAVPRGAGLVPSALAFTSGEK